MGARKQPIKQSTEWAVFRPQSEKAFVSQKRVSGFPEKRLTSGEVRGISGEVRETSGGSLGNFRGTPGLLFSSTVRELPGKSPKTSGEVGETSGEVRGLSRSSGEPDSLPVTRQICLQLNGPFHRICLHGPLSLWKVLCKYPLHVCIYYASHALVITRLQIPERGVPDPPGPKDSSARTAKLQIWTLLRIWC